MHYIMNLLTKNLDSDPSWSGIHEPKLVGDCGYDLLVSDDVILEPGVVVSIPSNVAVKIPDGFWMMITGRSSANKLGIIVLAGVIDCGYVGPLYTMALNTTKEPIHMFRGHRIAQCILIPMHTPPIIIVKELPGTDRGDRGFGSTS